MSAAKKKEFTFEHLLDNYSSAESKGQNLDIEPEEIVINQESEFTNEANIQDKQDELKEPKMSNHHDMHDIPEKRKPGRPKRTEGENQSKNFNLTMRPSLFQDLTRIAAKKQLKTGERTTVTKVINDILEEYVERENGDKQS